MIFETDKLQFQLLDVLWIADDACVTRTRARPFYALSLRTNGISNIVLSDGETINLHERDLALFHPNISYTRSSYDDYKFVFHFNLQSQVHRTENTPKIEILNNFRYDILLPLFSEAYQTWNSRTPGYHYRCTAILYTVFAEIRANVTANQPRYSPLVTEALRYLDTHYTEKETSVSALAEPFHI